MTHIDVTFLKTLRNKLKGGNSKSIHLNALPGRFATRLDLSNLNFIKPNMAEIFLQTLLSKAKFEFEISYDNIDLNIISSEEQKRLGLLSKRLNSLVIENDDNYKDHGIKTFSFGYPIIIKRSKQDLNKIIKAPLFIWTLEILKSQNKVNSWSILRNKVKDEKGKIVDEEIHSVGLNEVLLSFIKSDEDIQIPKINEELLEDAIIDKDELIQVCVDVLKSLNATDYDLDQQLIFKFREPISSIPDASYLESITANKAWIFFGGVFGLFRTQKESIITDIDILIERFNEFQFENLKPDVNIGTPFSAIETDPSQQEILNTLNQETKKVIQGPPGTGKSQSLTALITNALANDLKCLIVCEKKTALNVIRNNLYDENPLLSSLAAVIEDINTDRDSIVSSVRDRIATIRHQNYNSFPYKNILQNIKTSANYINAQHKQVDKKIMSGKSWTEIVGEYLQHQNHIDYAVLKDLLDYELFAFSKSDYELDEIVNALKSAKKLYSEINTLDHPLKILNDSIFLEENIRIVEIKLEGLLKKLKIEIALLEELIKSQNESSNQWYLKKYSLYTESAKLEIATFYSFMKGESMAETEQLPNPFSSEKIISQYLFDLKELTITCEELIEEYEQWLNKHYFDYYNELNNAIEDFLRFKEANIKEFGSNFFKNNRLNQVLTNSLSLVSSKYKKLKNNRLELIQKTFKIKKIHRTYNYVEHFYIENYKEKNLEIYVENIKQLETKLKKWKNELGQIINDYFKNISSITFHEKYQNAEKIKQAEIRFKQLNNRITTAFKIENPLLSYKSLHTILDSIENLNQNLIHIQNNLNDFKIDYRDYNKKNSQSINTVESLLSIINKNNIFKTTFKQPSNITELQKLVVQIKNDVEIIDENLAVFRSYYNWQNFFINQSSLIQTVIKAIIKSNCGEWEETFECWYLNWLLSTNENKSLPTSDDKILEYISNKQQLKDLQIRNVVSSWTEKQINSVRRLQHQGINAAGIFNKRGSKGEKRNSIRKIIQTDFDLFTSFFPVMMISPTVCSSILPLKEGLFDMIIFDEASQLRLEDTFPALIRGKIKVVSGDNHQMPPSSFFQGGNIILNPTDDDENESDNYTLLDENSAPKYLTNTINLAESESLLEYAENCGYKQSYLKIHYRSEHPYLIDFSNHAFYGKRLLPMPAKQEYKPIRFIAVNGLYEDQINRDEARQVVDILLHHIKPFKNGKYPSVGVATLNLYQRNLILEEITKARQLSAEYDKKINDLGTDFFVKNLENIQGDERDIMILSTTFGRKIDGTFRQNFGPLIQRNGYKLLNVIITRARYKIYVCTSIPLEHIKQYSELLKQNGNNGRGVFYAYLAYAKAISENEDDIRKAILQQLYENCSSKLYDLEHDSLGSESPFEDEVYYRLAKRIGENRLEQQYRIGGFRIDLIIKSEKLNKPFIAIECDGAKYHNSNEAYAWDVFRQKQLEQYGFKFYRIWSTNWWLAPEKELNKLVEFIRMADFRDNDYTNESIEELYKDELVTLVNTQTELKKRVNSNSIVTVKTAEGKILRIKFNKTPNLTNNKTDASGNLTVYERSPLAIALFGKSEGDVCQLGLLEVYYEIIKIE